MKTIYQVRFICYQYNSGAADNGSKLVHKNFDDPLEAQRFSKQVKRMAKPENRSMSGRFASEFLWYGGFVEGFDGIYKITEQLLPDGHEDFMSTIIHKGKFGFYPCDHATYLKLKELHKAYHQTLHDFHSWNRWNRKDAHNRAVFEPEFFKSFVDDKKWYKATQRRDAEGNLRPYGRWYPKTVNDRQIVDLYQRARMPQKEPVVPFDQETLTKIDALYDEWIAYRDR